MQISKKASHYCNINGFTLVEIMIVIAILGILAAIAIPQFSIYRIKGFNSSSLSDTRNAVNIQNMMFADQMSYGTSNGPVPRVGGSAAFTGSAGGIGALIEGSPPVGGNVNTITWTTTNNMPTGQIIGLGNQVSMISSTEVQAPLIPLSSFAIICKHLNGDIYYGANNGNILYMDYFDGSSGRPLVLADAIPSIVGTNSFTAPTVGPSGNGWSVR